jgi:hypothetical protein
VIAVGEFPIRTSSARRTWQIDLVSWRWSGPVLLGVTCLASGCSLSIHADRKTDNGTGTISGLVVLEGTPPIPMPDVLVTMHSQAGATRTVKASSRGAFNLRVATGTWAVIGATPLVGSSFCSVPTMIEVTRSQTSTVRIRMACVSSTGGAYVRNPGG